MNITRLFKIILVVTLACGLFGAFVGLLVGYGIPSSISYETSGAQVVDGEGPRTTATIQRREAGLNLGKGVGEADNPTVRGMALGGALGLILGLAAGIVLGLVDQFVKVTGSLFGRRAADGDSQGRDPPETPAG